MGMARTRLRGSRSFMGKPSPNTLAMETRRERRPIQEPMMMIKTSINSL